MGAESRGGLIRVKMTRAAAIAEVWRTMAAQQGQVVIVAGRVPAPIGLSIGGTALGEPPRGLAPDSLVAIMGSNTLHYHRHAKHLAGLRFSLAWFDEVDGPEGLEEFAKPLARVIYS